MKHAKKRTLPLLWMMEATRLCYGAALLHLAQGVLNLFRVRWNLQTVKAFWTEFTASWLRKHWTFTPVLLMFHLWFYFTNKWKEWLCHRFKNWVKPQEDTHSQPISSAVCQALRTTVESIMHAEKTVTSHLSRGGGREKWMEGGNEKGHSVLVLNAPRTLWAFEMDSIIHSL